MRRLLPRRFAAVAIGLALAGTLAASAWAANKAGQLDTSFGGTGYVTTPIGDFSVAQGVTNYDGGKTVAVGLADNGTNNDFAVARYNKDGSLDTSFGTGGTVTTDFGGDDQATSVAVMGDKIVVAGFTTPDDYVTVSFAVARYNKNGSLDTSFGTGGKVVTTFGDGNDYGDAVAVKGDKIVVAGFAAGDFGLAEYTKSGALDQSFGSGGLVKTDFDGGFDSANGIAFRGDTLIAAGYANYFSGNTNFALAAYDKRGVLDSSFGTGGKVETDFAGQDDSAHAVDVHGDRIVAVGEASVAGNNDFAAAVYDKRGVLDPKFNGTGKATMDIGGDDAAYGGGFGPGESVVAAGTTWDTEQFAVARWTKTGQPDPKFGAGTGFTTTSVGALYSNGLAMSFAPDDKIVVAGVADDQFAVARYFDNG
jgi:uncharacterized delta-60 repeat protein